jgi:hypothetical protein
MYRIISSIGLLLILASGLKAQEILDFKQINSESYRLYLAEEWDSVISLGKIAMKQEVDFYYLRMRVGLAQYNQKRYRQASVHFKKALEFNQADPSALEYLYYALLFSGQAEQANLKRQEFRGELALRLPPIEEKAIDQLGGEFLYFKSLTDEILSDPDFLFADLPPGLQYVTRYYTNTSLTLGNSLAPGIRLNHMFTYLSKYNFYYYNDGLSQLYLDPQHVKQYQYYISPSFTTGSGYTFMPMFHLLSIHFQAPIYYGQGYQGGNPQVVWGYSDNLDFVSGVNVLKTAGTLDLQLGAWYATLNDKQQIQNRLGLTWYPLGNLNFYFGGYLNTQYEISDATGLIRIIPEVNVGVALAEKVWLDLNAAFGDMTNYLEQNGSVVFNSFSDIIQKKVGLTVSIPLTEKGSLVYLGGRWTAHQSSFYAFDPTTSELTNPITYNAISIFGGISWKF